MMTMKLHKFLLQEYAFKGVARQKFYTLIRVSKVLWASRECRQVHTMQHCERRYTDAKSDSYR